MNEIATVVVTYNRINLLKECIKKIQEQTIVSDILIIDNASTDGTGEFVRGLPENVRYFNTGHNVGGAGGFHFGIKRAVECGYKFIWILDDDTMPTPTALEELLKKDMELQGEYGFLSSKVLWKNETVCCMNIQKKTKWRRVKNFEQKQYIQYASFVSLFVRRKTIYEIGLPYKEFFIWSDDWEFTRRISKSYKSYYVPESIVNHWCSSNVGADIIHVDPSRIERFGYMYRNDVVLYRQDGIEGFFYLFLRNICHIVRILIKTDNKIEKVKLLIDATMEGIKFYPQVEYPEVCENG